MKLDAQKVMEIRWIWANNKSAKEIAAMYEISPITVTKIVNQQSWKNLPSVDDYRRSIEWGNH